MAPFGQVTEHRQQEQHQGHHQLTPLTPPTPALLGGFGGGGQRRLGAWARRKASIIKGFQNALQGITIAIKAEPGAACHEIDTGLLHTLLFQQGPFNGPDTAAAFHPLHIQKNGGVGSDSGGATHSGV